MADNDTMPLFPPKSTAHRLRHFDDTVFTTEPTSAIFKFVDALCGDAGASTLKKDSFMQRLDSALNSLSFSDLDFIFGNISFLVRSPYESYEWDAMRDMLTSEQWDEIRVKDAWYRDRIRRYFIACGLGGTPDGMRMACEAATSASCDIYEVWRVLDNFGLSENPMIGTQVQQIGRAVRPARNEVVISPHKQELSGGEMHLLRQMVKRLAPVETIVTINPKGVVVRTPVKTNAASADSTYFQVEKTITPTPDISKIPPPELLAIDLLPSEKWLMNPGPNVAPYAAFNISQEYGYYYLISGGKRSPIDSVTYGTLGRDGGYSDSYQPTYGNPVTDSNAVTREPDYESVKQLGTFTHWTTYPRADSPDNYPGGKYGLTPSAAPALNPDRSPYVFAYASQSEYVEKMQAAVTAAGGVATDSQYRMPITAASNTKVVYTADLAIAYSAPAKDSTITSSWLLGKRKSNSANLADPSSFVNWGA